MKKHHMPEMKEGGVNVTPLIDVVMVLIVFFMLVAKIGVSRGEDQDIALPYALFGKNLDSMSNTMTLNVHYNRAGDEPLLNALVDGNKRDLVISKRVAGDYQLDAVLKMFQEVNKDKANIIVHADKDLPYSQLEPILLSCANAGIGNVSYETKPGEETAASQ